MMKRIAVLVLVLSVGSSLALFAASGEENTSTNDEPNARIFIVHCTS